MKIYNEDGEQIINEHKPNIGIAIILSLLCPGLGQIYCGKITRGIVILFGTLVLWITIIGAILAYFWQIFDAKNIATQINSDDYKI